MNNFFIKIQSLYTILKPYRWLLLPIIPSLFLLIFLLFLSLQPAPKVEKQKPQIIPSPTQTVSIPLLTPLPSDAWSNVETEWVENPETLSGFEKKQQQADGTILYIYTSDNPERPSITITNPSNALVFSRTLSTKAKPIMTITQLRQIFKEPEKIVQGSTYYGPQAQIFIYGSIGVAFVVNPQTNQTYEEQAFPPMNAEEYIQRYKTLN